MLQPALLGGLFIGILSALPIVQAANCCCLWIIGGGMIAAYLDQQNDTRPITIGRGALAGFLAGVVGAVVWVLASTAVAPIQEQLMVAIMRSAQDMPPETRSWFDMMANRSASPFYYVAGFMFQLLVGAIFSTLGGIIGAVFFRNDVPPALGGPIPPPLPPHDGGMQS